MKKIILFFLLFSYCVLAECIGTTPQDTYDKKMIPVPPNAAAFKIYGDIPVGHTTGVPDISIPIYEIDINGYKLPIVLRYHLHSAQKVRGIISNVALGWNLDFGGMITQSVNDLPDESMSKISDTNILQEDIDSKIAAPQDYPDYQYDNYSYSFFGNTGEYLNTPEKVIPFSQLGKKPVKIGNDANGNYIIDDEGVIFYFGGAENQYDDTDYPAEGIVETSVTHWLRKIVFPSGKSIDYTYSPFNDTTITSCRLYNNKSTRKAILKYYGDGHSNANPTTHDNHTEWNPDVEANSYYPQYEIPTNGSYSTEQGFMDIFESESQKTSESLSSDYGKMIFPKKIVFPNGWVEFKCHPKDSLITQVIVYNNLHARVKIINFKTIDDGNIGCQDLLESVQILDTLSLLPVEIYTFDYYEKTKGIQYDQSDFWGFYNGSDCTVPYIDLGYFHVNKFSLGIKSNTNIIFNINGKYDIGNKSGHFLANALKSITYPTGGKTEFIYEQNQYKGQNSSINGGGIRIQQILNTDNTTGITQKKTYKYPGIVNNCLNLNNPLDYVQSQIGFDHITGSINNTNSSNGFFLSINFTATKIINLPVDITPKYDLIQEYNGDTNNYSGYTEYNYSFDNSHVYDFYQPDWINASGEFLYSDLRDLKKWYIKEYRNWDNGQLIKKSIFKIGQSSPIKEENYTYRYILEDSVFNYNIVQNCVHPGEKPYQTARQLKWNNENLHGAFGISSYLVTIPQPYILYKTLVKYGHSELQTLTEVERNGSTAITKTTNYTYNQEYPFYPSSIINTTSAGVTSTIYNKYPFDYLTDTTYSNMVNKNILKFKVEEKQIVGDMQKITRTHYKEWTGIFNPDTISKFQSLITKPIVMDPSVIIDHYDKFGNPVSLKNEKNINIVFIWSYKGQYPIAEIENATYEDVVSAIDSIGNIDYISNLLNPNDSILRKKLDDYFNSSIYIGSNKGPVLINTYEYKPLVGLTSKTDPRGIKNYYEYDESGRLKVVYYFKNGVKTIIKSYDYHLHTN